jgi:hypothetical protein
MDAPETVGLTHVRAAAVEHWERDAASVLDVLGGMEPVFCEVKEAFATRAKLLMHEASRVPRSWLACAVSTCALHSMSPPFFPSWPLCAPP